MEVDPAYSRRRHLLSRSSSGHATVVAAVVAAGILGRWDLSVTAVLAVPADACVHVLRRRAYVSLASSPRTASTTLGCDVHQSLSAEIRWY
jgi:hypothetical protein